jgi:hypothetical protein
MIKTPKNKFQKHFEDLCKIFFSKQNFRELATLLLLGRIGMKIYSTESNYNHKRGNRGTSPLMYWEIGKELVEFAKRRKKDHDRFKDKKLDISLDKIINEVKDFLFEMVNQLENKLEEEELDNLSKEYKEITEFGEEKKLSFSATDFSKRSLIRCARLYDMINKKEVIDTEISWTFYAEFAEQYGSLKTTSSESRYILLENLIKMRKDKGATFSQWAARVYIYEFIRLVNTTTKIRTNIPAIRYMIDDNITEISKAGSRVKQWYDREYLNNPIGFET